MKYTTETRQAVRVSSTPRSIASVARALRYLRLSAVIFMITVVLCVLLFPSDVVGHYGLSFYGNFSRTFVPYTLGLSVAAFLLLRACLLLRDVPEARGFRVGLQWAAIAVFGIVVTPSFSTAWLVQDLHVLFGLVIFLTQAVLSARYLAQVRSARLDWFLAGLQFLAIVLVTLSFRAVGVLALMLPAQLLAIGSFGILLIRAVTYRARQHST